MFGFILIFFKSEPGQSFWINFDKFLDETIHKQLMNFHSLRHFRYYKYLLKIFLEIKHGEIHKTTFVSTECKRITLIIFINKVMSRIYSLIFNTSLPRTLEDMKTQLQINPENRVGDWIPFFAFNNDLGIWFSWVSLFSTCFPNSHDFFSCVHQT